jgi:hypothetical protein
MLHLLARLQGAIVDAASTDEGVLGIRRFSDLLAKQPGVTAPAVQTVGSNGYDGFCIILSDGTVY